MPYDPSTPVGMVRLLLSDVADPLVFTDQEISALLTLEGASVKRAAAQAIEVNATNMVLAMRVLKTQDLSTDGAKVATAMREHAASLREQAELYDDDGAAFEIVALDSTVGADAVDWFW